MPLPASSSRGRTIKPPILCRKSLNRNSRITIGVRSPIAAEKIIGTRHAKLGNDCYNSLNQRDNIGQCGRRSCWEKSRLRAEVQMPQTGFREPVDLIEPVSPIHFECPQTGLYE